LGSPVDLVLKAEVSLQLNGDLSMVPLNLKGIFST
jgi:hypothetical protein